MITKKEARAYIRRWRWTNHIRAEELRALHMKDKLRQMDACYRMAVGLGLLPGIARQKRRGEKEVRARWRRLKNIAP